MYYMSTQEARELYHKLCAEGVRELLHEKHVSQITKEEITAIQESAMTAITSVWERVG